MVHMLQSWHRFRAIFLLLFACSMEGLSSGVETSSAPSQYEAVPALRIIGGDEVPRPVPWLVSLQVWRKLEPLSFLIPFALLT
jgi:hypothetical protein